MSYDIDVWGSRWFWYGVSISCNVLDNECRHTNGL